jgi:hypothetical protein
VAVLKSVTPKLTGWPARRSTALLSVLMIVVPFAAYADRGSSKKHDYSAKRSST